MAQNRGIFSPIIPGLSLVFFASFLTATLQALTTQSEPLSVETLPVSEDYALRAWDKDDGLPNNDIRGIAQTADGYLWLATWNGVVRFDGIRFVTFLKDTISGLGSSHIETVFTASDGKLWLGMEGGGVARRSGNQFESIVAPSPNFKGWTSSMAEDADGAIWISYGFQSNVIRWWKGKASTFSRDDGLGGGYATYVHTTTNGKVWFGSTTGIGLFDGKRIRPINPIGGDGVLIASAHDGGMWAVRGQQLLRYRESGVAEVMANLAWLLPENPVEILYEDHAGDLWIGTRSVGLIRFHQGRFIRVPTSHSAIESIVEDREGNLWVGTQGGGLNRLRPRSFFLWQTRNGLSSDIIASLSEDTDGKLWLAGYDGKPVCALDSAHRSFAAPPGWPGGRIMTLCPDPAGGIWIGSLGGLMRWKNEIFSRESLGGAITALLLDRGGDLWAAPVQGGLVHRRSGIDSRIPTDGGLIEVRALAEDGLGRIWAGTEEGSVFQGQQEKFVRVPLPEEKIGQSIRFIVPDEKDTVWIGALEGGLYRWHAGRMTRLQSDIGFPVEDLRSLIIEPSGSFWFGTGRGLVRISRHEIEAAMDGLQFSVHAAFFGRNDGLPSLEFALGFRNATTRTHDGHLWFATDRGALEITLDTATKAGVPLFPVLIEEIQVNGVAVPPVHGTMTFPPHPGSICVRYTLPALLDPDQLRFRYRLTGLEGGDWVDAGHQRMAQFTYLPPGQYRFEVEASADGLWLPMAASVAFIVSAAWWETLLFRIIALLAVISTVGWAVRKLVLTRVRARMRILEQQHTLNRERIRIARDIHDELGANLTQIGIASQLAKLNFHETSFEHIDEIASITRRAVDSLDEIVWAINPRCDTLPAAVEYISQYAVIFFTSAGITCEVDIPQHLPAVPLAADVRHHLFLAMKETINNVVKHAGASVVQLKVEVARDILRLIVADDGRGFDAKFEQAGADGLRNMRERMLDIGGECRVESIVKKGTCVTFELTLAMDNIPRKQ